MTTPPPVSPWLGVNGMAIGLSSVGAGMLARDTLDGDRADLWLIPILLTGLVQTLLLLRLNRWLVRRDLAGWPRRFRAPRWIYPVGTLAFVAIWVLEYEQVF